MRTFQIWCEGFSATGDRGPATYVGEADGHTFREACVAWYAAHPDPNFDRKTLTHWACRLFDNEADARARYG